MDNDEVIGGLAVGMLPPLDVPASAPPVLASMIDRCWAASGRPLFATMLAELEDDGGAGSTERVPTLHENVLSVNGSVV